MLCFACIRRPPFSPLFPSGSRHLLTLSFSLSFPVCPFLSHLSSHLASTTTLRDTDSSLLELPFAKPRSPATTDDWRGLSNSVTSAAVDVVERLSSWCLLSSVLFTVRPSLLSQLSSLVLLSLFLPRGVGIRASPVAHRLDLDTYTQTQPALEFVRFKL